MAVTGGWPRKQRAVSWRSGLGAALLAFGMVLGVGCGSRTSMLDPGAYSEDGPALGGSSSGGSNRGGTPASPTAGSMNVPTPTAGQPNMQPPDPSATTKTCQSYCSGYAIKCPGELNGQDCQLACEQEMNGYGKECQTLGLRALKCLTPFFKKDGLSCEAAIGSALGKCSAQVQKFESCKGIDEPVPQPQPQPQPQPPTTCPGMGEGGPGYCKVSYSCPNGPYTVACGYVNQGAAGTGGVLLYDCACYTPNGFVQSLQLASTDGLSACDAAAVSCGFSPAILK